MLIFYCHGGKGSLYNKGETASVQSQSPWLKIPASLFYGRMNVSEILLLFEIRFCFFFLIITLDEGTASSLEQLLQVTVPGQARPQWRPSQSEEVSRDHSCTIPVVFPDEERGRKSK